MAGVGGDVAAGIPGMAARVAGADGGDGAGTAGAAQQQLLPPKELGLLIVRQLQAYGHNSIAGIVAEVMEVSRRVEPSNRLASLVYAALNQTHGGGAAAATSADETLFTPALPTAALPSVDLEVPAPTPKAPSVDGATYRSALVISHKGACRAVAFSGNGQLLATGGVDGVVKVLEVPSKPGRGEEKADSRSLLRTYREHSSVVNDLAFHPNGGVLAVAAKDATVRLYDLRAEAAGTPPFQTLKDAASVRCIAFHPTGELLLAGTEHPAIRLFHVASASCYSTQVPAHNHRDAVTGVAWGPGGQTFATSSKDGTLKLWDGTTLSLVATLDSAHGNAPLGSVRFSRNGKYLLTSGRDSVARLWDAGSGRLVHEMMGVRQLAVRPTAIFSWDEQHVLSTDEATNAVVVWDVRTRSLQHRLTGHTGHVRSLAALPNDDAFASGGDDARARYWVPTVVAH